MIVSTAAVRGVRLRRAISLGLIWGLALGVVVEVIIFLFPQIARRGLAPDPAILAGALPFAGGAAGLSFLVAAVIAWATRGARPLPGGTGSTLVVPNLIEVALSGGMVPDPARNWAIFVDLSNVALGDNNATSLSSDELARALDWMELSYDRVLIRQAYGDFSSAMPGANDLGMELRRRGFVLAHLPRLQRGSEKNHSDIQLAVDAAQIARARPDVGGYIIMGGDGDYTPLVLQLRTLGRRIHIIARERNTSAALIAQADAFVSLDTITGRDTLNPDALTRAETTLRTALAALTTKGISTPTSALPHLLRALGIDVTAFGFVDMALFQQVATSLGIIQVQDGFLTPGPTAPGADALTKLMHAMGQSVADFARRRQKPTLIQVVEPIWKADPALDIPKTTPLVPVQILHIAERLGIVQTERDHGTHELRILPGKGTAP
jgi:uncharacterized LabA/DUF88 family protein